MTNQAKLDAFLLRAGFTYGWRELESQARNMAEQAVEELDALAARLAEAERALREICAVDKAAPGRKDCHIWADMLAIASAAAYGRDSFMSLDELTDSASGVQK